MREEIRLLSTIDAQEFREIRINSLIDDPNSWLSSLKEEKDLPISSFANKIIYATIPPIFGYYGLFSDGKLRGYAQISPSSWNKKRHIVTLFDVCVAKKQRRKQIGKKIVEFITEKVKSIPFIEKIQLWVTSDNKGAVSFYESLGFERTSIFPESVKEENGTYQDEYLYTLKLKYVKKP